MDGSVATGTSPSSIVALRPVIFVVDATSSSNPSATRGRQNQQQQQNEEIDEPFDVPRTNTNNTAGIEPTTTSGRDYNDDDDSNLYDEFLSALQGKLPGDETNNNLDNEDISISASFASSCPPTPRGEDPLESGSSTVSSPTHPSGKRFLSPFSRLRGVGGRWRGGVSTTAHDQTDTTATTSSSTHILAQDMEEDDLHDTDTSSNTNANDPLLSSDNVSTALSSYSREHPPIHFMSKRARVVSVSSRHAFPPSKFPKGKMDPLAINSGPSSGVGTTIMLGENTNNSGSGASKLNWMSSYQIENEGILPIGWLEKHARALPSAIIIVTTLQLSLTSSNDDVQNSLHMGIKHASNSVENIRMTLAEKRSVPIHLVCLIKEDSVGSVMEGTSSRGSSKKNLNPIKEKICQECYLPQSQVFLIRCPSDLEPDEFECGILRSPYLDTTGSGGGVAGRSSNSSTAPGALDKVMMNPILRQLDRSLRDSSASYYSRLAEAQERKLMLWRNRYHNTNTSFEVNTLLAAMRCARYAMKVGTLREFQMRTGGNGSNNLAGSTGRWTDKSSLAMRHYDEAYRWVVELHRRAIAWRAMALSDSGDNRGDLGFQSPGVPITPGGRLYPTGGDGVTSPKLTESPGGGNGFELSYPGAAPPAPTTLSGATPPPPPMRRNSPALTSKKGYNTAENIAFFALLWEQCRAVASIINAKLLRTTSSTSSSTATSSEAEEQWSRHRIIFLSNPQGVNFSPSKNDDFFGPAWHRFLYITEELLIYACVTEGRWRRSVTKSTPAVTSSYHQAGAPWKAYGELCEAMLGLRRLVEQQIGGEEYSTEWMTSTLSGRRRFVGSIVAGDSGFGTMPWKFQNESKRDHRALALDYVLHALDLLDENITLSSGTSSTKEDSQLLPMPSSDTPIQQPIASCRLHYLAGRLLMSLNDPSRALVHLNIAASQTKSWPSLHLSIQRALTACNERCSVLDDAPVTDTKKSFIELLINSDSCKLLSPNEMKDAQVKAWEYDSAGSITREVVWNNDDTGKLNPPFEFAVSFLNSTHATTSDKVKACVSIKSCLDFHVEIESMQLVTTSGIFDVPNLSQCAMDRSQLQSLVGSEGANKYILSSNKNEKQGVEFNRNDLAFFMTELTLPSNLSDVALGGIDTSKFIPKSGRLCNMGLSHAAGNICESRFDNEQQQISINGKPISISSISESSSSFLGGVPLACHGVVLTLKHDDSSLKLQIDRPTLISPLLRSGAQRSMMEESNYTAHSWYRPAHHPWFLGPRVLRVLGPRPHMHVTNLTEPQTHGKAVEGTVNRIVLKLNAGIDEDCWDVRVRLKCTNSKKPLITSDQPTDATPTSPNDGSIDVEPDRMPIFVQKSKVSSTKTVSEGGVTLPTGWSPREDVGTDESHDVTTLLSSHLEAGKSLLCPLDIFRPLDKSFPFPESDACTCSTSYEVVIMYRQVRAGKGLTANSNDSGDEVMVMQSGSIEWIAPFKAEFSQSKGPQRPFACGIQHSSNMVLQPNPPSVMGNELVIADGERVHMRCSLKANGLGSSVTASILDVTNESSSNQKEELYSAGSGLFINQTNQGSKLSLSYSVLAQKDIESANGQETIPLGIISVNWKPSSLDLPDGLTTKDDEFGSAHGPLCLSNVCPMIFHGPQCKVLSSPFSAKLLKCPSTPKVGVPFAVKYQITNKTAKSQSLVLNLNDAQDEQQLLGTGKSKEESQLAPFEAKTFSFTFMSMVAGNVVRPPLTVSSGRHQTYVINETLMPHQTLFVMP